MLWRRDYEGKRINWRRIISGIFYRTETMRRYRLAVDLGAGADMDFVAYSDCSDHCNSLEEKVVHIWHRGEEYLLCFRGRVLFRLPRFIGRWLSER